MDTSWARAEAEMVEVQQNILKYPTLGTITSFFPMYERALYILLVHYMRCYNQYNWEGLECKNILPSYVVPDYPCAVQPKSNPSTLCNLSALRNDARGNCPPQMPMLDLSGGKLGVVQWYILHAWNLRFVTIAQATELCVPINANHHG